MPPLDLPTWAMAGLNVVLWAGWSPLAGYLAHRLPVERFETDTWFTRLRPWEQAGARYERLHIRRWKNRLPEAGALFEGGFAKRSVSRQGDQLERFVVETRRAEWAHRSIMAAAPVTFLWNWWWVDLVMVAYALAANLPCLLVQRYNRARLLRLLARRARHA